MTNSTKPGPTRAPKARLRVRKITVRQLSGRRDAEVKGGMLEGTAKRCLSK